MKTSLYILSTLAIGSVSACHSDSNNKVKKPPVNEHPNILYVFTDQQTINDMSAYGNQYLQTPNMDELAKFGVRFTESYCTSPVCSASRSSMITSRMPHTTGVIYNETAFDSTLVDMGQVFANAGYQTVWAGKWHLPDSYPYARGKDSIQGFKVLPFFERDRISGRGDFTDKPLADAAVKFLLNKPKEPFLLCVSFHNPHDICYVPSELNSFDTISNIMSAPPVPDNFNISKNEPEFITDCRNRQYYGNEISMTHNFSKEQWRFYLWNYYRMTERVDKEIGKLIEALESAGLDENTLIIFSSDHGDGATSHQWAAKLSLYEEAVKVPFIITWFGKTPEGVVDNEHLVSGLDIFPTLCDYAGITPPSSIKGKSLKPIIDKPNAPWRNFVVTELAPDPKNTNRIGRMIRTKQFKYMIYSYGKRNEQLFDITKDPGEMHNLVYLPAYLKIIKQHQELLQNWIDETNDYFSISEALKNNK